MRKSTRDRRSSYDLETADGVEFRLTIADGRDWRRFVTSIGLPRFSTDPRYCSSRQRFENRYALLRNLRSLFAQCTLQEWLEVLDPKSVTTGRIGSGRTARDHAGHNQEKLRWHPQSPSPGSTQSLR